jgi:hypothetical protein
MKFEKTLLIRCWRTATLLLLAISLAGCAAYRETGHWTPDGFNYTLSRDRQTGDLTDYWGFSWSLK